MMPTLKIQQMLNRADATAGSEATLPWRCPFDDSSG